MKTSNKKLNLKKEQIAKLNTASQSVIGGTGYFQESDFGCETFPNRDTQFCVPTQDETLNGCYPAKSVIACGW